MFATGSATLHLQQRREKQSSGSVDSAPRAPLAQSRLLLLAVQLVLVSILVQSATAGVPAKCTMQNFLNKKYKLSESENFDEFMKALGVSFITRKMGAAVNPVVEVTEKDGEYMMRTTSTFKNQELPFKLGVEFEEETPDGRKVKSTITCEGNKLIHVQKGEKNTTIERTFSEKEMKAVMKVDDIVCTRVYKLEE